MEDQSNPNAIERVRHVAQRRRALLILVGIGLLLLVLATAHACVETRWDSTFDLDEETYGGHGRMAAGFNYCQVFDPLCEIYDTSDRHVHTIRAGTEGVEFCLPSIPPVEQDWYVEDFAFVGVATGGSPLAQGIDALHVLGEGGFDLVTPGCLLEHQLIWGFDFDWESHGEDYDDGKIFCFDLIDIDC